MLNIDIQIDTQNIEELLNNLFNNISEKLAFLFLELCKDYFEEIESKFSRYNLRIKIPEGYKDLILSKLIHLDKLGYRGIITHTSDLSGFVLRDITNNINYKINLKYMFQNLILKNNGDNLYIITLTNKTEIDKILVDIFTLFFNSIGGTQMIEFYLKQKINNLQDIEDFDTFLEEYNNSENI